MEIVVKHVLTLSEELKTFLAVLMAGAVTAPAPETSEAPKTRNRAPKETVTANTAPVVNIQAPAAEPVPVTQADIKQAVEAAQPSGPVHPGYQMEEVRAKAQDLAKKGHKDAIKNELTSLGAANVPALDKAHYPKFMDFLNDLESI